MKSSVLSNIKQNYIDTILLYAKRIFLVGDLSECEVVTKYFSRKNFKVEGRICFDQQESEQDSRLTLRHFKIDEIKFQPKDVIFITYLDAERNKAAIYVLNQKGIDLRQIIPAGYCAIDILAEENGFINKVDKNELKIPFMASFDLVDTCNLKCSTCMRKDNRGSGHKISKELFIRCLNKLKKLGFTSIEMHKSTEPFLHPQLIEFVYEAKRRGFRVIISSNFSLPNMGEQAKKIVDMLELDSRDVLVASISGLKQEIYEINHNGGNIETVIKNLQIASQSKNRGAIRLRLLTFDYNFSDIPLVKELAEKLGICYEIKEGYGKPAIKQLANVELPPF